VTICQVLSYDDRIIIHYTVTTDDRLTTLHPATDAAPAGISGCQQCGYSTDTRRHHDNHRATCHSLPLRRLLIMTLTAAASRHVTAGATAIYDVTVSLVVNKR